MPNPFKIYKDIYAIGGMGLSNPDDCCVYLIDAGELLLIDAGAGRSFAQLVNNIEFLGFQPEKIEAVIATHAHIDHLGSMHQFQDKFKAKIVAHELDADQIETGKEIGAELYGVKYEPCKIDVMLKGSEETLKYSKYEIKLLHIPGHTPGSIAVYVDMEKRVLFGQDIHGPYFLKRADPKQAKISLQKLVELEADILCEGHFGIYETAADVKKYIEGYANNLYA